MSEHKASVSWKRETSDFNPKTYNRSYQVTFAGGIQVAGSAAPEYMGNPELTNPEEMFVSALAGCHMLTFLFIAARQGMVIDSYVDEAVGTLGKNAQGKMAITHVTLKPQVSFSGDKKPTAAELEQMHHQAHETCFIANSVTTSVDVQSK